MAVQRETLIGCIAIFGGILIHFTFGHFYTVSNMIPYILSYIAARVDPEVQDKYAVWLSAGALGIQGITMPLGGWISRRYGFRIIVAVACLLESLGVILTYFTIKHTFIGVIITYCVLKGAGLGLGYSVVLSVASSWFPERRGLIVGMVVGGFGLGSLVFTPIQTAFVNPKNLQVNNVTKRFTDEELLDRFPNVFLMLGGILLGLQLIGFILLRAKPKPASDHDIQNKTDIDHPKELLHDEQPNSQMEENLGPLQMLRRIDFYLLWFVMFCNIIPITIVTSTFKLFGQTYINDDAYLTIIVTISALFNCGGRIIWGLCVDKFSFKPALCLMLTMWAFILITFPHLARFDVPTLKVLYAIWVFLLFFSLSGVFAIMPAATGRLFGQANLAVNYGLIFFAFASGSTLCALLTTFLPSKNAYLLQFTGVGCVCILALFTVLWIDDKQMPKRLNFCRWCSTRFPRYRRPGECHRVQIAL